MPSILNATTTSGLVTSADNSGSLQLQTNNGTTAVTIDTSQNVGIGTASPSNKLSVVTASGADGFVSVTSPTTETAGFLVNGGTSSNKGAIVRFQKNASTKWTMGTDSAIIGGTSDNFHLYGGGADAMLFSTNATERMRITSGGAVCIGRTTQIFGSTGLCVETSSNSVNCVVTNSSQSALSAVNTAVNTGTSCSLVSFNVGISGGGSQIGTITYNGTNTLYNSTSDQRLKKNIVDAGSGLEKLAGIKIRAFDWIEHDNHTDFGVVAQELITVAPEAVSVGDDKETIERVWAVDTATLVPAMIKAIQELKAELDATKAEVQALKGVA